MKRVERLGEAVAPDGSVLTLYRHDGAYSIRVGAHELMSTRRHHSEDVLAELVCAPLAEQEGARVLIGGLGLGFTLRTALGLLAADAQVVVAEIVDEVIRWNRNPDYALAADALADPRVDLRHDDVANVLQANPGGFDAIMLDVDNGAAPLTTRGNAGLYRAQGIRRAAAALRPGGRLAYWSADPDAAFEKALRGAGLTVQVERVRAHPTLKSWHTIFVARRAQKRTRPADGDAEPLQPRAQDQAS
ncbi:spermidine synthase [Longimicrobium sp.]|uniref:spermidine synthase n=1 Tax=Longimicrobium sp. TaxID=2029185 RepID=UPI003B3A0C70